MKYYVHIPNGIVKFLIFIENKSNIEEPDYFTRTNLFFSINLS